MTGRNIPGDWYPGVIPANVDVGETAYVETSFSFHLFRSEEPLGIRIGRAASVYLGTMFDVGRQGRVDIGDFSLLNGARVICDRSILIGDYCLISWGVVLMDTYRVPVDRMERRRALEGVERYSPRGLNGMSSSAQPVRIEENVWIGFDTCVLPGVTIGQGSVVGARSVVREDIPPCSLAAGNPARVIRTLELKDRSTAMTGEQR